MALKHTITWVLAKITGGDWNNTDHEVDADGLSMVASSSVPNLPVAGKFKMWARRIAGRTLPASVDQFDLAAWTQPFLGRNKIGVVSPVGGSSAQVATVVGLPSLSSTSAVARNIEPTNFFKSLRRVGFTSPVGSNQNARMGFSIQQLFWRGNAPGLGGFFLVIRAGTSDAAAVTDARGFMGMSATSVLNLNPSGYTNLVGLGHDGGDANMQIITNDGTGTATKIDLGPDFPANTLSEDMYELALFCPPNASFIGYQVTRLNRPDIAPVVGELTSDIPQNTALMMPSIVRSNGPSGNAAVSFDLVSLYIETDN